MPTRPTLRILSCDTNRRKTTILAFCIAGLPIVWEEWNHLVLSNLFLQVRKKSFITYSSGHCGWKFAKKSIIWIFMLKFNFCFMTFCEFWKLVDFCADFLMMINTVFENKKVLLHFLMPKYSRIGVLSLILLRKQW